MSRSHRGVRRQAPEKIIVSEPVALRAFAFPGVSARLPGPRKFPRQARSLNTLQVITEAAAQVLERGGYDRLTTTAVAERAGVSIGSVYQYFADKTALVAWVARAHLGERVRGLSQACLAAHDRPLAEMAAVILEALLLAKASRRSLWRAPLAAPEQAGIGLLLRDTRVAGCRVLTECLASCSDAQFEAPEEAATTLLLALSAPLQGTLAEEP